MAASTWAVYDGFQQNLGAGGFNLSTDTYDIHFYTTASNAATSAFSALSELNNEIAATGGYTTSGKQLSNPTWTSTATGTMRFDCDDFIITATGGNLTNIRYAVIIRRSTSGTLGTNRLVAVSALSTTQFTVNTGSTLTVQMNANGVFQMTSA